MGKLKSKKILFLIMLLIIAVIISCLLLANIVERKGKNFSSELARARNYVQLKDEDKIVNDTNDCVEFSAFFLRDLNGDGYATPILGTCKEIGKKDTLYIELNVKTHGYLKNGKITIDGKNFYLSTAIPKDDYLKSNYIGFNTNEIELNQIDNGTQKLLMGVVTSGNYAYESKKTSAIGNNIDNYSRNDNKIIFTGIYVDETGHEENITKEVDLTVDWYGKTKAEINRKINQTLDIDKAIDTENGKFLMKFPIYTAETENQLNLKKSILKGTIPELNGYAPVSVNVTGNDVTFTYNEETREFTAEKNAVLNEENKIIKNAYDNYYDGKKRETKFNLEITYPLEAYRSIGADTVEVKIPIQSQYEGFNNPNEEFMNPYKSNIARETIVLNYKKIETQGEIVTPSKFEVTVGKRVYSPYTRWIVSKKKPLRIYNELSSEEKDDTYIVSWYGYQGKNESSSSMVMKETADGNARVSDEFIKSDSSTESMSEITKNIGIYFSNPVNMLGENGWIKVYNDETNELLETFTSKNWSKYSSDNPYKYTVPVKHIRVETSQTNSDSSMYVYNVKELDDEYITEHYTLEEFENLSYIKSTLVGYLSGEYKNTATNEAHYEAPLSVATISVKENVLSTQETKKNEIITINANKDENYNIEGWTNGEFLVKFPQDIINLEVNEVTTDKNNVKISSYEVFEKDGNQFIKINTSNNNPEKFAISIDVNITPNPIGTSNSADIELYAVNEESKYYYSNTEDIYDVNGNLNVSEKVNYNKASLSLVSPNTLLTCQIAKNYDENDSITVAPQIAEVTKDKRTANIEISTINNYSNTISEVKILGKIPFANNSFILNKGKLGSTFSTTMSNTGIIVPDSLQGKVKVYYSENEDATKDLTNEENSWKEKDSVTDWSKVKTFLIDFEDHVLQNGEENTFSYEINIPRGIDYNKVAYSTHAIYFCLDTEDGKYSTQTEPNKLGFRIAKKFDLELIKYQQDKENVVVPLAKYSISKVNNDGTEEFIKTATTGNDGKLLFNDLYTDFKYAIREIKSPSEYELNEEVVKFTTSENNANELIANLEEGTLKTELQVRTSEEKNTVLMQVEDKVRPSIRLIKTEEGTETRVTGVKYKLTGKGFENGRIITTDNNGEVSLKGLYLDEEYILEETKAEGYYLGESIKFKIENNEGVYSINITEGTIKNSTVDTTLNIPVISIELEDKKIPRYNLQIEKIKKVTNIETGTSEGETGGNTQEVEHLAGAKFRLYKGEKEIGDYITDENGIITIENLYQYESEKDINQTYTLKEVLAPAGYVNVKDITFKVEKEEGELKFKEQLSDGQAQKKYTVEGTTVKVVIEDSPTFKLIKKDAETGELLANIKFAIYNVDEGQVPARNSKGEIIGTKELINGREYYVVQTDANGELTADLTEGFYKAVELEAPEKYDISDNTYYFGIGVSREGEKGYKSVWGTSIGGNGTIHINSMCETSDGGQVAVGVFNGTIDLGDGITFVNPSIYSNMKNGIIIKYTSEGTIDWARNIGGNNYYGIESVIETSTNEILVGGYFSGIIDLGNENILQSNGSTDGMIIKYSETGEVLWAKSLGGSNSNYINSVCETQDVGIAVGGYFSGSIDLGNGIVLNNSGSDDGMIIKFSSEGEAEWARSVGGSINSICATKDGGVAAGGNFNSSSLNLENGNTLDYHGSSDGFIIKYLENGDVDWAKSIGGEKEDYINSICATKDGDIIAGGYFKSSSIVLEDKEVSNNSDREDGILIKYTSAGNLEWVQNIGGTGQEQIKSVCATKDGGVAVGGYYSSRVIELGNGIGLVNYVDSADGMLIKYNSEGVIECANQIGDNKYDYITSVYETRDEGIIVGGCFQSSKIVLDNGIELEKKGTTSYVDGMIIKFEEYEVPDLIAKKGNIISGNSDDVISMICKTKEGGIVAGGYFTSDSIDLGNGILLEKSTGISNIFLIKYNDAEEAEWAKTFEGTISAVLETRDEDLIVLINSEKDKISLENGIELNNPGVCGGIIIKYSKYGDIKWAKLVSGNGYDSFSSVCETQDGGFVVVGRSGSDSLDLGNGMILENNSSNGIVIKYNSEGEAQWAKSIGQDSNNELFSVCEIQDGEIVVGGYFSGERLNLGNGLELINTNEQNQYGYYGYNGVLIKYSLNGEIKWAINTGEVGYTRILKVCKDPDGGFVALNRIQYSGAGIILKYDEKGKLEWKNFCDNISDICVAQDGGVLGISEHNLMKYNYKGNLEWKKSFVTLIGSTVLENENGEIITAGVFGGASSFMSPEIQYQLDLGNGNKKIAVGGYDGMILKWLVANGTQEQSELLVKNKIKEFKITTEVEPIDGIKGGSISGEGKNVYEKVKYGDTSTQEIIMTPDNDYEIISITVNGEDYSFTPDLEGKFTIPQFENVTEDKHVVVKYALKDNKITIIKKDSITGENLSDVIFKLDQLEERSNPELGNMVASNTEYDGPDFEKEEHITGELTQNGNEYTLPDKSNEVTGVIGELTNDGEFYFTKEDGKYMPNNLNDKNTLANSYISIDLTEKTGKYALVVNAETKDDSWGQYLCAVVNDNNTMPNYNNNAGRFIYLYGNSNAKDYITYLEAGQQYYLHLGYRNQSGKNNRAIINSINLYGTTTTTYNFEKNEEEKYVPNNLDVNSTVANSYIPIDLTSKTGKYAIVVNAETSGSYNNYLYATITENTTAPAYNNNTGRFVYLNGNNNVKDYTTYLEAGNMYYLHLGYYNYSGENNQAKINSIKLYETKKVKYNFIENNGKYESNNQGRDNTVANSYIPIDLTDCTGIYDLKINAQISSDYGDYGYATVTQTTDTPAYDNSTGRFIFISGTQDATDYSTVLDGGYTYYLHLGYYKNAYTSSGDDKFTVNSIKVTPNADDLYHTTVTTNSEGQAITQIPFGKYQITEIRAPEEYWLNEESTIVEFRSTEGAVHEFTMQDEKKAKVIVHHYLKGTETPIADDVVLADGKIGEEYTTEPITDSAKYELEKDESGEYKIPLYANGKYTYEDVVVTYYYVEKEIPLTVHYYLEGTSIPVKLQDGTDANDITDFGRKGTSYNTSSVNNLKKRYQLTTIPENAEGTYNYDEVVVTYYYNEVSYDITTEVKTHKEKNDLDEEIVVKGGTISGENETPYESVYRGENCQNDIVIQADEKYRIRSIVIQSITEDGITEENVEIGDNETSYTLEKFNNVLSNKKVIVEFEKKKGNITVHHYFENTNQKVISESGEEIEDEVISGYIDETYNTYPSIEIAHFIELVSCVGNEMGEITEDEQEVIYYYRYKTYPYTIKYYYNDVLSERATEHLEAKYLDRINYYPDKSYGVWALEKEVNKPLLISDNEENNVMSVYYVLNLKDYTIHYKEQYTEYELAPDKVVEGNEVGSMVEERAINIDGYVKLEPKEILLEITNGVNEATFYYTKRTDLSYKVNYLEKGTNEILHEQKVVNNKTYKETITASNEVIEITGYNYDSVDKETLEITTGENEINIYYVLDDSQTKELSYTVEYYKDGTKVTADTQTERKTVQVLEPSTMEVDKTKINTTNKYEGYKLDKTDPTEIPDTVDSGDVIKVYYVKKDSSVIVHHYFENTTEKIVDDDEITDKKIGDSYTTSPSSNVPQNYECIDETPDKYKGTLSEELVEVTFYYKLKAPTVSSEASKQVSTDTEREEKVSDEETRKYFVLTEENGVVTYIINYNIEITDYIGNADIEIVDTLPATIKDSDKEIDGGDYSIDDKTITWIEHIENINTFDCEDGKYKKEITKTIKVRFDNQDLTKALVNKVNGNVKLYYPDNYPEKSGEKLIESSDEAESTLKQEYKVELNISKVWDDNNNAKEKRPESVTVNIKSDDVDFDKDYILNDENEWKCTVSDLQKYTETGKIVEYEVSEKETNIGDLEYYEEPKISVVDYNYTIKNEYKMLKTDLNAEITKEGTGEINRSNYKVEYKISFTAEIDDYIGSGKVKIIDTLPYKIDEDESDLDGGKYDENTLTITWEEDLEHINTQISKETYKVEIEKQLSLKYKDVDYTQIKMTNKVFGKIELYDSDEKDEAENIIDTSINVQGIVKVRFVDKETGKDITYIENQDDEKMYNYEIKGKVGDEYKTEKLDIKGYTFEESTNNETGKIAEEEQEVIYYYKKIVVKVIVKYVDEEGNEIAKEEIIEGQINDKYETENKKFEEYELIEIPENYVGEMTNDTITVVYTYKKKEVAKNEVEPTKEEKENKTEEKPTDETIPSKQEEPKNQPEKESTTQPKTDKKNLPVETVKVFPEESKSTIIPTTQHEPAVYTGDNEHIAFYIAIITISTIYLVVGSAICRPKRKNKF